MRKAGTRKGLDAEGAAKVLSVNLETLDADRLAAAFRMAALANHPDTCRNNGTTFRTIDQLRAARAVLQRYLTNLTGKPTRQCPQCLGNKKVNVRGSFTAIKCPRCGGRGEIK